MLTSQISKYEAKLSDLQMDYQSMYNEMRDALDEADTARLEKVKLERDVEALVQDLAERDRQL
jgi:outer membrane murein-binding lipoprotein Lpp